jgi:hypothetical protein
MRAIRETDGAGEKLPEKSVFSARLRPELHEASLAPMVVGGDMEEVTVSYVKSLRKDGYSNIFFHLDLAYGWQAVMSEVLMQNGFSPKMVLPHAAKSDVVVFQYG